MKLSPIDRLIIESFSSIEKQATYQTVCGALRSDGVVDGRELNLLEDIKNTMQISTTDIIASRSLTRDKLLDILRAMPDHKKMYVMKFIAMMCLADGKTHPAELEFVQYIENEINAPKID